MTSHDPKEPERRRRRSKVPVEPSVEAAGSSDQPGAGPLANAEAGLSTGARPKRRASYPEHRHTGDHDPVVSLRGLAFVAVAVVVVALLLPSATRPFSASHPSQDVAAAISGTGTTKASGVATSSGRSSGTGPAAGRSGATGSATSGNSGSTAGSAGGSAGSGTVAPAPSAAVVLVANGSNVDGLAGTVTSALTAKGYRTLTPVNALTTVPSTLVYPIDTTGSNAASALLAVLGLPASAVQTAADGPPPVTSTTGADIVVIAGADMASRFPATSSTSTATGG